MSCKFTSHNNTLELDSIDWSKDLIAFYTEPYFGEAQYVVMKWKGDLYFINDSNGVGESWIAYEHDIKLEFVPELSDDNLMLLNFNEDHVVELLANELWKLKEKMNDEF